MMNKRGALSFGSALLVVLCMDALFLMSQSAIKDINPASNITFLNNSGILQAAAVPGSPYVLDLGNASDKLPGGITTSPTGDILTDTFNTIRNWITGGYNALHFVWDTLGGPYTFLANPALDLPLWFSFSIGAVWYLLTFFLLVMFLAGR